MADIFASLRIGATFDKQKYKKDIDLFKSRHKQDISTDHDQYQHTSGLLSKPLEQDKPKLKSKKQAKKQLSSQDDGVAIFASQQQQSSEQIQTLFTDDTPKVSTRDPFEEANVIRKTNKIKIAGTAPPPPLRSFAQLSTVPGCHSRLLKNMAEEGFLDPTPIQRQAITALLQQRELLAVAPTGSGKTLAFLIPLVLKIRQLKRLEQQLDTEKIEEVVQTTRKSKRHIKPKEGIASSPPPPPPPTTTTITTIKGGGLKALVISPTKELSTQSARVLVPLLPGIKVRASVLSKATAAGTDFSHVDILFANPLRLGAMSREGKIDLSTVEYLILDEADKLFDMGFAEQIDTVIAACTHTNITRALFSATLPDTVEMLARNVLGDPLRITVGERGAAAASIEQKLLFVGRESGRLLALRQIISQGIKPPVLVFVSTKERAKELRRDLMYDGVHIDCIHSDQPQAARVAAIDNFRLGKTWILIATDLLGRGMDFAGVNTVVNYDFPHNTTDYVHRIGRTGRAGRKGMAVTFFAEEDVGKLRGVANIMRGAGCQVPEWMLQLKKQRKNRKRKDVDKGDVEEDKKENNEKGDGKKRKMMVKSRRVYGGRVTGSEQKQKPKQQNNNKA